MPRRTVLVSGGASGLGRALCEALEARGDQPLVLDRRPWPERWPGHQVDLADGDAAHSAARALLERHGALHALVTAAGVDRPGDLIETDWSHWRHVLRVNLEGTAALVSACLPSLLMTRGHVVTVASTLGLRAVAGASAYCASKFGVVGFTRALAAETAGRLDVTLLIPGGMQTGFFEGREERFQPPADARLNDPAHVATAVLFALDQPAGCSARELVIAPEGDASWPP